MPRHAHIQPVRRRATIIATGIAAAAFGAMVTVASISGATSDTTGGQTCTFHVSGDVVDPSIACAPDTAQPTSSAPTSSTPPTTAPPSTTPSTTPPPTKSSPPPSSEFPDATDTGVPAGTELTNSGPVTTSHDGQVIENLKISGLLLVKNANVVIRNCEIVNSGNAFGIELYNGASHVTIQDTTIHGVNQGKSRLMYGIFGYSDTAAAGLVVQRVNAYWISHDMQVEQGVIEDSYFHDMGFVSGDHTEPIGSWGGSSGSLTIKHNTILNDQGQTAAVYLTAQYGNSVNRTVTDNLMAGGGYTIYGGARSGGYKTSNIVITNNQFSTRYFPKSGYYGAVAYYTATDPGNTWSGNTWADGPSAGRQFTP